MGKVWNFCSLVCVCALALLLGGCKSGDTQLRDAIQRNDTDGVKKAIASGANINSCANEGWGESYRKLTPLGVALSDRRSEPAMALIAAGADPNLRDYRTCSPLGYAMETGNGQALQALLAAGADANALMYISSSLAGGETPLTHAAKYHKSGLLALLLKHGVKVDLPDRYGCTAFWHAGGKLPPAEVAKLGEDTQRVRQLLLAAGAKPDPRDKKGRNWLTAQKLKIDYDDEEEEDERRKMKNATEGPAESTLRQRGIETRGVVRKLERPPRATNLAAQTRLYQAIEKSDIPAMKQALKSGAVMDATFGKAAAKGMHEDATPLILAIELEKVEVVQALLNAGAKPMVSASTWSPLIFAARRGKPAVVSALLNKGANPNFGTYSIGETALMHAVGSGSVECVKLLLARGADPDARTNEGNGMSYFLFTNEAAVDKLIKQASQNWQKGKGKPKAGATTAP